MTEKTTIIKKEYPLWHNIISGGVAGAGSRLATAPLDLVRIRWQLEKTVTYPRPSLWSSIKTIVENEGGVRALFRGSVAATYLWIGYSMVQFSVYGKVKGWFDNNKKNSSSGGNIFLFCFCFYCQHSAKQHS